MARCALFSSLQKNQTPKKPGDKPGCSCYKMPPLPTKKVKTLQIVISNTLFVLWPYMGNMFLELFHGVLNEQILIGLEKMSLEEDDEDDLYEWEKDLPVEIVVELVPAYPDLVDL